MGFEEIGHAAEKLSTAIDACLTRSSYDAEQCLLILESLIGKLQQTAQTARPFFEKNDEDTSQGPSDEELLAPQDEETSDG